MRLFISCVAALAPVVLGAWSMEARAQVATGPAAPAGQVPVQEANTAVANSTLSQLWYGKHAVQLEVDDLLSGFVQSFNQGGKLQPAHRVTVLFYQSGKLVGSVRTNESGNFQAKIPPGVYTVIAGDLGDQKGFSSTSVRIVPYVAPPKASKSRGVNAAAFNAAQPEATRLPPRQLQIALIPAADVAVLRRQIVSHIRRAAATQASVGGNGSSNQLAGRRRDFSTLLGDTPEGRELFVPVAATRELSEMFRNRLKEVPFDGPFHFNHQMFINTDRTVRGRLSNIEPDGNATPVRNASVYLARGGRVQLAASGTAEGTYILRGVTPGVYSMIAITPYSFGAYGIEYLPIEYLVDPKPPVKAAQAEGELPPLRFASAMQQGTQAEDPEGGEASSSIANPEDVSAFLGNDLANGLDSLTPTTQTPPSMQSVGGPSGNNAAAAVGAAVLGSLLGYGLYEALNSHNN